MGQQASSSFWSALTSCMYRDYAALEVKEQPRKRMLSTDAGCSASSGTDGQQLPDGGPGLRRAQSANAWQLGTTIPEWSGPGLPATGEGPYWAKGTGTGLQMRCGPNYRVHPRKQASSSAMYEACGLDIISANVKLEDLIGRLVSRKFPSLQTSVGDGERGAGVPPTWTAGCPVPRVLCINLMLPYESGLNPFDWTPDPGVSVVGFFHVKPETLKALNSDTPPASLRLWREFCAGPAGEPHGPKDDPSRSLDARRNDQRTSLSMLSGLFKMTAFCENPSDVGCPESFHQYNGKPCLITKSGYIVKDPLGEWMEIGIDVRMFNALARKMLCSFRGVLPNAKIHYGFWIQAVEDEDMPEGLVCDVFAHGVDIMEHAVTINDPEGEE